MGGLLSGARRCAGHRRTNTPQRVSCTWLASSKVFRAGQETPADRLHPAESLSATYADRTSRAAPHSDLLLWPRQSDAGVCFCSSWPLSRAATASFRWEPLPLRHLLQQQNRTGRTEHSAARAVKSHSFYSLSSCLLQATVIMRAERVTLSSARFCVSDHHL